MNNISIAISLLTCFVSCSIIFKGCNEHANNFKVMNVAIEMRLPNDPRACSKICGQTTFFNREEVFDRNNENKFLNIQKAVGYG